MLGIVSSSKKDKIGRTIGSSVPYWAGIILDVTNHEYDPKLYSKPKYQAELLMCYWAYTYELARMLVESKYGYNAKEEVFSVAERVLITNLEDKLGKKKSKRMIDVFNSYDVHFENCKKINPDANNPNDSLNYNLSKILEEQFKLDKTLAITMPAIGFCPIIIDEVKKAI